jgi:hypothetical protein
VIRLSGSALISIGAAIKASFEILLGFRAVNITDNHPP